jgi:hypothetical protein
MAVTLTTTGTVSVNAVATGTASGLSANSPTDSVLLSMAIALTNGTGAVGTADIYYSPATVTITTGANHDLDVSGSVVNGLGQTVTMARVKLIIIRNNTTTAGFTAVVGNGSNPLLNWVGAAAHTKTIRPGGFFVDYAPDATAYAVTAATGDILRINNPNASSITVDYLIVGASA